MIINYRSLWIEYVLRWLNLSNSNAHINHDFGRSRLEKILRFTVPLSLYYTTIRLPIKQDSEPVSEITFYTGRLRVFNFETSRFINRRFMDIRSSLSWTSRAAADSHWTNDVRAHRTRIHTHASKNVNRNAHVSLSLSPCVYKCITITDNVLYNKISLSTTVK